MAIEMVKDSKGKGRAVVEYGTDDELPPPLALQHGGGGGAPSNGVKKSRKSSGAGAGAGAGHQAGEASTSGTQHAASSRRSSSSHGNFRTITATSRFPLAPIFALDSLDGVRQVLQSWVMRYVPSIDGVLVSFQWPPEILQSNAPLAPSSAYALIHARWTGTIFRPQIGSKTTGRLSLATPSTISLLLHNLFNASISADQIPKDKYEWDPNAKLPYSLVASANLLQATSSSSPRKASAVILPSDPSLGAEEIQAHHEDNQEEHTHGEDAEEHDEAELGCWVHKETREPLGGTTGHIDFTVIGLTIANSMISTHGSLLDQPIGSKDASKSKKRKKDSESKSRKRAKQ